MSAHISMPGKPLAQASLCSIDGCRKPRVARGWCRMHYVRWHQHGDPGPAEPMIYYDPEEAFAARTERQGECLIWTGALSKAGYGVINSRGKTTRAHQYAWEREHGKPPKGMEVDHLCWSPACCEISHLRLVTHKQNQENRRGAQANGSSGVRGVSWDKNRGKWLAHVKHDQVMHNAGRFDDKEEAAAAAKALRDSLFTHHQN